MSEENDLEYYEETANMSATKEKSRRNVWTEKKNAALVELVKVWPYLLSLLRNHAINFNLTLFNLIYISY